MRPILLLVFSIFLFSCSKKEDKILTGPELDKVSQTFSPANAVFCRNPWVEGYKSTAEKLGLKPSKNKYGESSDENIGWVKFKMKLIIPPAGKSVAHLESTFIYFSENCWGDTNREGAVTFDCSIENIIANSSLENEYLVSSKNGDLFDVYIENPTFRLKVPKDACDYGGVTVESKNNIFFKPQFR